MAITGAFLFGAVIIFFAPLLGVLGGAFSGWVVSMFFDETIRSTLIAFNIDIQGIALWKVGATLGFVGGFFRSHQTNSNR